TNQERESPETNEMLKNHGGLDNPVIGQYGIYLSNLLQGDFGISFQFKNQTVAHLLGGRIGASFELVLQAIIFGTVLGWILGSISAIMQYTWADSSSRLV
ncbi:ABC transporter permease, partial [Enterococcus faecium]